MHIHIYYVRLHEARDTQTSQYGLTSVFSHGQRDPTQCASERFEMGPKVERRVTFTPLTHVVHMQVALGEALKVSCSH